MANNVKQMHRFLILYQMNTWHPKLIVTAEAKDLITNRLRHNALTILRRESTTTLLISHVFGWIFRCPRLLRFIWAVWALWALWAMVVLILIHHTYIVYRYYINYIYITGCWKDGRVWIAMRRAAILLLLSCRCRHMVRERAKPDMMHYPLPVQAGTPKSVVEPFMAFIILHRTASFLRPWHHLWLQWIHERDQSGIASCEKVRYSAERGDWRCISLHISPLRGYFWKI